MENRLTAITESPYSELNKPGVQDHIDITGCAILRAVIFVDSRNVISKRVCAMYWLSSIEKILWLTPIEVLTFREYFHNDNNN